MALSLLLQLTMCNVHHPFGICIIGRRSSSTAVLGYSPCSAYAAYSGLLITTSTAVLGYSPCSAYAAYSGLLITNTLVLLELRCKTGTAALLDRQIGLAMNPAPRLDSKGCNPEQKAHCPMSLGLLRLHLRQLPIFLARWLLRFSQA